ncbi:MAG: selenoneine biosynthesis selenosugar synthase SenB [Telluria sp.]
MKRVAIVSPALAGENNGNWQTASRWAHFLAGRYRADIVTGWTPGSDAPPDLMIALHARRSAAALAAFAQACPERPCVLVLTGTDLYRDIHHDPAAQASLEYATALVVLQDAGVALLPLHLHAKTRVIRQSAPPVAPAPAPFDAGFTFCMIGHLRPEKDPLTFMRACTRVTHPDARFIHIGGALDPELGAAAQRTAAADPRYRWLGNLPHDATRIRLAGCHAMVIASVMEGGANVIIEAVTSGVPVLASDISGNRGMLGDGYAGYFPVGDSAALASLMERSIADQAFIAQLRAQCAARAALFSPAAEQAAVLDMVDNLIGKSNSLLEPS